MLRKVAVSSELVERPCTSQCCSLLLQSMPAAKMMFSSVKERNCWVIRDPKWR
jgi:hypothetical protein